MNKKDGNNKCDRYKPQKGAAIRLRERGEVEKITAKAERDVRYLVDDRVTIAVHEMEQADDASVRMSLTASYLAESAERLNDHLMQLLADMYMK